MNKGETRRYLSDVNWRRDIAHREFVRAMRTGRMMAFVGSYATEELGYPKWEKLLRDTLFYTKSRRQGLSSPTPPTGDDAWLTKAWEALADKNASRLVIYEMLNEFSKSRRALDEGWALATTEEEFSNLLLKKVDALFSLNAGKKKLGRPTAVWQLCRNLGIRRIITTNYDMEFEYELMIDEEERWRGVSGSDPLDARKSVFKRCREQAIRRRQEALRDEAALSRFDFAIEHVLPDSRRILSDCFQRERSDKLFEFSIGSPDPAWHIMHLHGRISDPETLIISYSDYNRQYRESSITKLPFEHAMKLLFAGNPILFVGMGMSEEEILSVLRQFVSDGRPGYVAQHFVIWSSEGGVVTPKNELFRLQLHMQYGVHVLFDCELKPFFKAGPWKDALANSIESLAKFAELRVKPFGWTDHDGALPTSVGNGVPPLTHGGDFRDMQDYLPVPHQGTAALKPAQSKARADRLARGSIVWGAVHPKAAGFGRQGRQHFSEIEIAHEELPSNTGLGKCLHLENATPDAYFTRVITRGSPIKAFIDRPGSGHGSLANVIGDFVLEMVSEERRKKLQIGNPAERFETLFFQINGSFTWELDSAFSLVSGLFDDRTAYRTRQSRGSATRQFFGQIAAALEGTTKLPRALFLVINGADRFFDASGYPLSNELDLLIRRLPQVRHALRRAYVARDKSGNRANAIHEADQRLQNFVQDQNGGVHPVTLILFGSARVGRYLSSLGFEKGDLGYDTIGDYDLISSTPEPFASSEPSPGTFFSQLATRKTRDGKPGPFTNSAERSLFLNRVEKAFERVLKVRGKTLEEVVPRSLLTALRRFEASPDADTRRPFFDIYIDARLLALVLSSDPKQGREAAARALDMLRVMAFLGQPVTARTLKIAMAGIRSPQSGGFQVTLSEIEDTMDELLKLNLVFEIEQFPGINTKRVKFRRFGLHRALLHEIRDRNSVPYSDARNYTSFNIPLLTAQPIDDHEPEDRVQREIERMVRALIEPQPASLDDIEYGMQLRAASASLRSYYTTSTLLMHEPESFPSERPSPKLRDHADLIDQLIHWAEKAAEQRRTGTKQVPPNFFADDLVWLHAQRGVALMAFGDLYAARDSLSKAAAINDNLVEFGDHGQNWRRIQLNQIHLDIERAKIASAEARVRDLKASINQAVDDETWHASWRARIGEKMPRNAFEAIMQAYGTESRLRVREVDPYFAADLILSTGLACGYRGWCEYLRGRLRTAEHYFSHCIQILRNIGELRAYALFARHYASLLDALGKCDQERETLLLCQAAADSSRQMDISHLAALTRAEHRFAAASPDERAELLQSVKKTLRYATLTDMYRVRLEARRVLALMRFRDGDFDGALEQASEALAVAARFGFTLRKIALRILVGEILVKRGDPISGASMLEQATLIADRLGYQRAVEEAYRVRTGHLPSRDE